MAETRRKRSGSATSASASTTGASTDDTHVKSYSRTRSTRTKPSNITTILRSTSSNSIANSDMSQAAPTEVLSGGTDMQNTTLKPSVRRTPSGASVNVAGRRTPVSVQTPTTASTLPSLARTVTTDDSDDYQSAISAPETSDHDHGAAFNGSLLDHPETMVDISAHQLGDETYSKSDKIYHVRDTSLSSAKALSDHDVAVVPSPTLSDHTMASTGTVTSTKYGRSHRRPHTSTTSRGSK